MPRCDLAPTSAKRGGTVSQELDITKRKRPSSAWKERGQAQLRYILDPGDVKGPDYPPEHSACLRPTKSSASANTAPLALFSLPTTSSRSTHSPPNDSAGEPARLRRAHRGAESRGGQRVQTRTRNRKWLAALRFD